MAEKLHRDPIPVSEHHHGDNHRRDQKYVMFVVLNPVQNFVSRIRHEYFGNDHRVSRGDEDQGTDHYEYITHQLIHFVAFVLTFFDALL